MTQPSRICIPWLQDLCLKKMVLMLAFGLALQGPLFQQRPYPSPGAVLRKNAEIAALSKKQGSHNRMTPISKRGDGSDGLGDAD